MRFSSPSDREKAGRFVSWVGGQLVLFGFGEAILSAHAACSESIIHVGKIK
jgi:hypothetical protein